MGREEGEDRTALTSKSKRDTLKTKSVPLDTDGNPNEKWYIDTGANVTLVNDLKWFTSHDKCRDQINIADNTRPLNVTATATGTVKLIT